MPTKRVPVFTELLPATPCTPGMREAVLDIALSKGVSLAEVQRDAISLFLTENYSKTIEKISEQIGGDPQRVAS